MNQCVYQARLIKRTAGKSTGGYHSLSLELLLQYRCKRQQRTCLTKIMEIDIRYLHHTKDTVVTGFKKKFVRCNYIPFCVKGLKYLARGHLEQNNSSETICVTVSKFTCHTIEKWKSTILSQSVTGSSHYQI